jgi:hypothetical protein
MTAAASKQRLAKRDDYVRGRPVKVKEAAALAALKVPLAKVIATQLNARGIQYSAVSSIDD